MFKTVFVIKTLQIVWCTRSTRKASWDHNGFIPGKWLAPQIGFIPSTSLPCKPHGEQLAPGEMRSAAPPAQSFSHSQQQTRTHSSRAVLTAAEQYSQEQSGTQSVTKKKSSLQCSTSTHLMMGANSELARLRSGARSKV